MSNPLVVLIGGGARSGKSAFALELARGRGRRRVFLATAQALDAEMQTRIAEHARCRGNDFITIEEPVTVPTRLAEIRDVDVVVVDCLTLWLSNLLLHDQGEARILDQVDALASVIQRRRFHTILVTNEVGMGLVPEGALGRAFRDLTGRAHQRLAGIADEIYLAVIGVVLRVRPEPISLQSLTPMRG